MWVYDLKYYWRKWRGKLFAFVFVVLIVFLFRFKILGWMGGFLISEDQPQKVELAVVLGGNAQTRAERAAELYSAGWVQRFVCTGAHHNEIAEYYDVPDSEAKLTAGFLINFGVSEDKVRSMDVGTSTREEYHAILKLCQEEGIKSIMLISDRFHTRRVRQVFEDGLENIGVRVIVCGASHDQYDECRYWEAERGLIMVFEEYVKMVYYWLS